jgi:hypothetical protein
MITERPADWGEDPLFDRVAGIPIGAEEALRTATKKVSFLRKLVACLTRTGAPGGSV